MSVSSVQPAQAISSTSVHGAWQLLSYDVEEQANGNTFAPMGDNPSGYVIFTAEGRLSFMLSAEGRQPGSNAEERSALLSSRATSPVTPVVARRARPTPEPSPQPVQQQR